MSTTTIPSVVIVTLSRFTVHRLFRVIANLTLRLHVISGIWSRQQPHHKMEGAKREGSSMKHEVSRRCSQVPKVKCSFAHLFN